MREWFSVEAAAKGKGGGEILIYGSIGKSWWDEDAVSAKAFVKELDGLVKAGPGDIHIRINSPGGNVGDGMAIYNAIRNVKDRCYATIEGTAYSMASVIALAGRETRMHDTGQYMVHNPIVSAYGGEKEMESAIKALKTAKTVLVKAYTAKTGKTKGEIEEIMGDTTFMTADEAKEFGFVDSVIEGDELQKVAACFDAGAWAAYYQGMGPMPSAEKEASVGSLGSDVSDLDGGGGAPVVESGPGKAPLHTGDESPKEKRVMPVKFAEIKAKFPKASLEFVSAQFELCEANESRTIEDVKDAYIEERDKALEAANAAAAAAETRALAAEKPKAETGLPSVSAHGGPGESEGEPSGDPIAAWEEAVEARVKKGMTRQRAVSSLSVEQPQAHEAYLNAYNEKHGVQRRLA